MVNWIHFPKNKPLDKVSAQIVKAFEAVDATIDSYTHQLKSDEVLTAVRPGLEALGFDVEKSKKSDDLVAVPVLYGVNGKIEKAFEADGYLSTAGYVIEVEAGRAVVNYQFLKDFFEACTMVGVDKMSDGFEENAIFFDLEYLEPSVVSADLAFDRIAPILWLAGGCKGEILQRQKGYVIGETYVPRSV